ncbi:hypothetical protein BGW39_008885 [Mortierella sp. 14UC]|nr:hypothetical protein BGW39_008885 [Mortierella sp. 14UC]
MDSLKIRINSYQERILLLTKMIENSHEQLCDLTHYQTLAKEIHSTIQDGVTSPTAASFGGGAGILTSLTNMMANSLAVAGFDEPDLNAKAARPEHAKMLREREEIRQRRVEHTTDLVAMIKRALVEYCARLGALQDQLSRQPM